MILQCIPDYRDIKTWADIAEQHELCFEYNEFFIPDTLANNTLIDVIISRYQSIGRDMSGDTLHGVFFDICVNSQDPLIKEASVYRIQQSLEIAEKMGLRGAVFHTNYISGFKSPIYREDWVKKNIEFWREICDKHKNINVYMENMFDESPELLTKVAYGMRDVSNFGVCLDLAHAQLSDTTVDEFVNSLSMYIRHIHINDNDGRADLHNAVGDGLIDWSVLNNEKLMLNDPSVLIEVSTAEKLLRSLDYLKRKGYFEKH